MPSVSSEFISTILHREEIQESEWRGEISYSLDNSTGMHRQLQTEITLIHAQNSSIGDNIDILVIYSISHGLYIDVYELESRHDFRWPAVQIHTATKDTDYESVAGPESDDNHTNIGIEFLAIPIKTSNLFSTHPSNTSYPGMNNTANLHVAMHTFSIPIHTRYHAPSFSCSSYQPEGDSKNDLLYASDEINIPLVYFRPSSPILYAPQRAGSYKPIIYYDETRLGSSGNYEEYYGAISGNNAYKPAYSIADNMKLPLTVHIPIASCANSKDTVQSISIIVSYTTAVVLLIVLLFKS